MICAPMSRRGGFTLLEVLIAIAIAAVIAVLGYRAIAALTESESRLSAESARWRVLDLFFARLEADMRLAVPRSARYGDVREPGWAGQIADSSGNSAVSFSRAGPEFSLEPGSAGQRIGYRLREGVIEVLYWAGYDRPTGVAPTAYPLLSDVSRFRLAYLARDGTWAQAWPLGADADPPRAVRVELTLASGEVIERWLALR
jgi:general secretion pathway protein J